MPLPGDADVDLEDDADVSPIRQHRSVRDWESELSSGWAATGPGGRWVRTDLKSFLKA